MIRPLRGRVAIRMREDKRTGLIWHPDQSAELATADLRSKGLRGMGSHVGTVLALGAPPLTKRGAQPAHAFGPGDEVVFVFAQKGTQSSRTTLWEDDEPCVWIAWEEVIAVLRHEHAWEMFGADARHGKFQLLDRCRWCNESRVAPVDPSPYMPKDHTL